MIETHRRQSLAIALLILVAGNTCGHRQSTDATPPASPAVAAAAAAPAVLPPAEEDVEEHTAKPIQTDFPFQTLALGTNSPVAQIVNKSVTIRLGLDVAVSFDTDLLRMGAGWTGEFVKATGVTFDASHGTHPSAGGSPHFVTAPVPGWADARGRFQDPRRVPFGPIPESWGRWDGLYVVGDSVVLSYTVNGAKIVEQPSAVRAGNQVGFVRTFRIAEISRPLSLLVADVPGASEGQKNGASPNGAGLTLSVAGGTEGARTSTEVAVVGNPSGTRLESTGAGRIVLHLPRGKGPALFKVIVTRTPTGSASALAKLTEEAGPPKLVDFRAGGARHWPTPIVTKGSRADGPGPYLVDRITTPYPGVYQGAPKGGDWKDNIFKRRIMIAGFDFFPGGTRAALSTWEGDVWIVDGIDGDLDKLTWHRFASGLFEPLGLAIVGGVVHTTGRDQITRLHDLNGDGEADFYENFNNQATSSQGFHEFQFDLQTDAKGYFYTAKAAPVRGGGRGFGGGGGNGHITPFAGTIHRISPDGKRREIYATGLRAPNGIGVSPEGQVTTGDNEGTWMPACPINWVRPGSYHGVEDTAHRKPVPKFDPPLCWISKAYDNSGGGQIWVTSDKWGPFKGELLHMSYGRASIYLVVKQQVDSLMQGGIVRLVGGPDGAQTTGGPVRLTSSAMRARFNPVDGQLYVAGLSGWQSDAVALTGFDRIRYNGKEVYSLRGLTTSTAGVELKFSHPLDPSSVGPQSFSVERWNYQRTSSYGSPEFSVADPTKRGHDQVEVMEARLGEDQKSVLLDIDDLRPAHQMLINLRVKTSDGAAIRQSVMFTIHKLPKDSRAGQRPRVARARPRGEPGLLLRLTPESSGREATAFTEVAPVVKLHVGNGSGGAATVSPFVPAGPFTATWQGTLWPEMRGDHILKADVAGRDLRVTLNDQVVLTSSGSGQAQSRPLSLDRKANKVEVELRGARGAATSLRLSWARLEEGAGAGAAARAKSARFEPIPPSAFRHERTREVGADLTASVTRRAGRELFLDHRCAQCHIPEAQRRGNPELGARAPDFAAIGSRLEWRWLRDWILDPKAVRPTAQMPALLQGPQARADAEAIAAYLATLRDPKLASLHEEGARAVRALQSGRAPDSQPALITTLRCGGCHVDQANAADDGRLPMQGSARKFLPGSLARYLENPAANFPWNPMPHFRLSRAEALELEAFLRPEPNRSAPPPPAAPSDMQVIARGRSLLETTGCLHCHEAAGTGLQNRAPITSLASGAKSSCLEGTGPARHRFSPVESAQLRQFLAGGLDPVLLHVPAEFAERQVRELRCNGCHGKFEGIPELDRLGEKLRPEWMAAFLAGKIPYKPRGETHPDGQPWLPARMPAFSAHAPLLAAGLAALAGHPARTPADNALDPTLVRTGATLVSAQGGFSCIACHGVGNQPPTQVFEAEGINFRYSAERLRPEFFRRWLLDPMRVDPSTRMPNYFDETGKSPLASILDGHAEAQIEAIWHYLRQLSQERPGGVAQSTPFHRPVAPPVPPVASSP